MLEDLRDVLGDRSMVLHKEMTKLFEGAVEGSVGSVLSRLREEEIRGEYTLVVAGNEKKEKEQTLDEKVQEKMARLLKAGTMSLKDIARKISSETGMEYRRAYKACLLIRAKDGCASSMRRRSLIVHSHDSWWLFSIDGAGQET